jgi:hypothetical protein
VTGACKCPEGQTKCSGVCTNLNTDPQNCGACGTVCNQAGMLFCGGNGCHG